MDGKDELTRPIQIFSLNNKKLFNIQNHKCLLRLEQLVKEMLAIKVLRKQPVYAIQ